MIIELGLASEVTKGALLPTSNIEFTSAAQATRCTPEFTITPGGKTTCS